MKDYDLVPLTILFLFSMGLISKTKPLSVEYGFNLGKESAEHDCEGRFVVVAALL